MTGAPSLGPKVHAMIGPMGKTLAIVLTAATACLGAEPAARTLSSTFDGARGAARLESLRPQPRVRLPQGRPVEPPDDLVRAREHWGSRAQSALLDRLQPEPKTSFTFAVIGDSEGGRFPWQRPWAPKDGFLRQIRAIQAHQVDLIFQLGDSVGKGTVKNYRAYLSLLKKELHLPLFHLIGNHDRSDPNSDKADKTLDTPLKTLLFTHVPPAYLKGRLRSAAPKGVSQKRILAPGYFEEGSARFGEIVSQRGVVRVYMGHIHAFGIADHGGVRYVLSGGGGSPLYPLPGHPRRRKAHYIIVQAGPEGLSETVHELDGTVFPIP